MHADERLAIAQAEKVARILSRQCWWAEQDDLRQAGALAAIKALRAGTYIPGESPLAGFLYTAALYGALRALRKASSPVGGTASELKGLYRASLYTEDGEPRAELTAYWENPEQETTRQELCERVRTRLSDLLGEDCASFTLGLIGGVYEPADVVAEHGGTVHTVYRLRDKVRRRLDADPELYDLWKEARL
jgi:DNA-directed RNA polymerase specialized sigma24 family protein